MPKLLSKTLSFVTRTIFAPCNVFWRFIGTCDDHEKGNRTVMKGLADPRRQSGKLRECMGQADRRERSRGRR
jgi:hypothetical protein